MRRLKPQGRVLLRSRARLRGERGAVATVFAILLAGGVVLGMLALSVDVGGLMWERRQLQNGSDATSLALADICAADPSACNASTTGGTLTPLLNSNAADGLAQLNASQGTNGQCGRATGSAYMPTCLSATNDASLSDLAECPPIPTWLRGAGATIPYVETYSLTRSTAGTLLPSSFAQLLTGTPGSTVSACARAAWGPPASYSAAVPITFSHCEWQTYMNTNGGYVTDQPKGAWPGYGSSAGQSPMPPAGKEFTIFLHSGNNSPGLHNCYLNNKDTAGGFGYLEPDGSGACLATVSSNGWAKISTGNSAPSGCSALLATKWGKVISLPVFSCLVWSGSTPTGGPGNYSDCSGASAHGSKSWYYIAGWAKFYLTGYKISGSDQKASIRSGSVPCSGNERCLSGWFLKGSLDATSIAPPGGGSDYGTYTILPAG